MQSNRNDGAEVTPRRANPSPAVGNVRGLGESHALSVDLRAVQLPWLADEIAELRGSIEEGLARERAHHDQLTAGDEDPRSPEVLEASAEVARRGYQLEVLAMIREQLPVSDAAVAAGTASPWQERREPPDEELDPIEEPVAVVGPTQGMLVLIGGAARNVAGALAEALDGPKPEVHGRVERSRVRRCAARDRITAPVATRLRALAAAAEAFTETYVDAVVQQSYSFDPDYYPVLGDELW